jgi:lipase ATG15
MLTTSSHIQLILSSSLGGGLAIISAAQTHVGGVAISGPNAMLSRESFDPKLKVEDLNEYAFNFIPERDAVAHVDDPARLNQILDCKAPVNSLLACHNSERTICELMTGCGSQGRPVPCICFTELGYPRPTRKEGANRTLEEACDIAP